MSFLTYKPLICEGDIVIVCRGLDNLDPIKVESGKVIQVGRGAIQHSKLIGLEYGSKVLTSNGGGWATFLHPTPELWTASLPHRTQIIYATDISMVTMQLGLRPGSEVCECGTGSGSLSHSLARTVAPNGHLYTFEFHQQRADIARKEFADHGLSDVVTLECRDVCKDGFGLKDRVDAVFLDVPNPWEAVRWAYEAIKASGGRFCSFSPCIEQVQRTAETLREASFVDIEVVECLQRPYSIKPCDSDVPALGFHLPEVLGDQASRPGKRKRGEQGTHTRPYHKGRLEKPIWHELKLRCAQPCKAIRGHTGFLLFATLNPKCV
eukprot:Em0015g1159a